MPLRGTFVVALLVGVVLLLALFVRIEGRAAPPTSRLHTKPKYCQAALSGSEGYGASDTASYRGRGSPRTLRAVALVIRHGDRSAIHPIHNSTSAPPAWRCDASAYASGLRPREWPAVLTGFVVRHVSSGAALSRSLRPSTRTLDDETTVCEPGQLTPRGFEQVRNAGRGRASLGCVSH